MEMNPYELFPLRVWEIIMDLAEVPDKLSVLDAYPLLETDFQSQKHEWVLSMVLPIVFNTLKSDKVKHEILSESGKALRKALFNSRLVSPCICKSIDHYLESYCLVHGRPPNFYTNNTLNVLHFDGNLLELLQKLGDHAKKRNPILGGYISIPIPVLCEIEEGFQIVEGEFSYFIEHAGKYFLSLELFVIPYEIQEWNITKTCQILEDLLWLAPNLRRLYLKCFTYRRGTPGIVDVDTTVTLPELPFLNSLEISIGKGYCPAFLKFASFDKYFPQLVALKTAGFSLWNDDFIMKKDLFANLVNLSLFDEPAGSSELNEGIKNVVELAMNSPNTGMILIFPLFTIKTGFLSSSPSHQKKNEMRKLLKLLESVRIVKNSCSLGIAWSGKVRLIEPMYIMYVKYKVTTGRDETVLKVIGEDPNLTWKRKQLQRIRERKMDKICIIS